MSMSVTQTHKFTPNHTVPNAAKEVFTSKHLVTRRTLASKNNTKSSQYSSNGVSRTVPLSSNLRGSAVSGLTDYISYLDDLLLQLGRNSSSVTPPSSSLLESTDDLDEVEDLIFLVETTQKKINNISTELLNTARSQEDLTEMLFEVKKDNEELYEDLTESSKGFSEAKKNFDLILEEFHPERQEAIRTVLRRLEEGCSEVGDSGEEEATYIELPAETEMEVIITLMNAHCITPHPVKPFYFKLNL